jgi:superfamily I DNA/RNA helicase
MDYKAFVNRQKTLIVAPAGYGKTHTIAECLKHTTGKQLILTHTHAGVASIKEKIKKENVPPASYRVDTISSFSQRYVEAFYTKGDKPEQDSKDYHRFIAQNAQGIFQSKIVAAVVRQTYSGLFVDEYQDCSKLQHQMISCLSRIIPTRILGDPLQGIFDFNGDAVDFDKDLVEFEKFPELETPHRWHQKGNNQRLGDIIKGFRELLQNGHPIVLTPDNDNGFHVVPVKENDIRNPESTYRKGIEKLIDNPRGDPAFNSLLLIVPEYFAIKDGDKVLKGGIFERAALRAQIDYKKSLRLLEAIDDKSFYSLAKKSDLFLQKLPKERTPIKKLRKEILDGLFNKTDLDIWFSETGLKRKKDEADKAKSASIQAQIDDLIRTPSSDCLLCVILELKNELRLKFKREEIVYCFIKCLRLADIDQMSIYESMKKSRNVVRRVGRKVHGTCLGTARLTKGLEFDTVAILDADKFDCPKSLYVALSRSCKKLVIFTSNTTLSPYKRE